jgi:hypothetical protein
MTDQLVIRQPALERWASMLQPLFPPQAELTVLGSACQLRFRWPPDHAVAIFIAPRAVDDFLEAQDDRRARADENLREFVKDNLNRRVAGEQGEFRIVVASIDFVPLQ